MPRSTRMFEIVQLLRRAAGPMTAATIAERLEVTKRTVYRDIAALQAQRVPVEGEAGIGYIMRPGYDLPPLMFDEEEVEAIIVGLAMLRRAGDGGLLDAARRVAAKIADVLPEGAERAPPLHVSDWSDMLPSRTDMSQLRAAIRDEQVVILGYEDAKGQVSQRTVLPLALTYNIQTLVLLAWCELREAFRHFRIDRIATCALADRDFRGQGAGLRTLWAMEGDD